MQGRPGLRGASGAQPACFAPASVEGRVFDSITGAGTEGAPVIVRDADAVAVSSVAITAKDGRYEAGVPSPWST